MTIEELVAEVEAQAGLLIAVATEGPRIDEVNAQYKARRRRIRAELLRRGLTDPFPWLDLWRWHADAKEIGGWRERRLHIRGLADPLIEQLYEAASAPAVDDWGGNAAIAESWADVEGRLVSMRDELRDAASLDDFQDVGRRAREVVIAAANIAYDSLSPVPAGERPGRNDSKGLIDHVLEGRLSSPSRANLRRLVRAAYDLMQTVTHSDSVRRAEALAAAQAAVLIVRTLQELDVGLAAERAQQPTVAAEGPAEPVPTPEVFHAGDRVRHPKFGEGIVIASRLTGEDDEVTVAFVGQGVKRLVARFARLERSGNRGRAAA